MQKNHVFSRASKFLILEKYLPPPINILTNSALTPIFRVYPKRHFLISKILQVIAKIVILHQNPNYSH